jgi:5-bromo-4-chloroindolyl phosphate hydrolysis protein
MKYVFAALLLLLYIIFGPILFMWSLNKIFSLNILYTFNNWLAVYIFLSILSISVNGFQKSSTDKYINEKTDKTPTGSDT